MNEQHSSTFSTMAFSIANNANEQTEKIKKRQFRKTNSGNIIFSTKEQAQSYIPTIKHVPAMIPDAVVKDVYLSNFSKVLYGKIVGLCKRNNLDACVYTNSEIEQDFYVSQRTAVRSLHLLEKMGYIDIFYLIEKSSSSEEETQEENKTTEQGTQEEKIKYKTHYRIIAPKITP